MQKLDIKEYKKLKIGQEFYAWADSGLLYALCYGFYEENNVIYVRVDSRTDIDDGVFFTYDKLKFITKKQYAKDQENTSFVISMSLD